jgi:hypothetical protein
MKVTQAIVLLAFAFVIFGLLGSMFILESKDANRIIWPSLLGVMIGLATYSMSIVFANRGEDPDAPKVVAYARDELSANAVVVKLEAHGIKARAIGGFTSTEVGSDVAVVVSAQHYEAAMRALDPTSQIGERE